MYTAWFIGEPLKRLHIGVLSAKQFLRALDRQRLDTIGEFLAAVVASARIAFRILVCKDAAVRGVDFREGVVLGWNQFESIALTLLLADDGGENFRVGGLQDVE